jgi:hypothetical protein
MTMPEPARASSHQLVNVFLTTPALLAVAFFLNGQSKRPETPNVPCTTHVREEQRPVSAPAGRAGEKKKGGPQGEERAGAVCRRCQKLLLRCTAFAVASAQSRDFPGSRIDLDSAMDRRPGKYRRDHLAGIRMLARSVPTIVVPVKPPRSTASR